MRRIICIIISLLMVCSLCGCSNKDYEVIDDNYRNYYEVFVYSFCDSDGDGIGDINGLISKLDYIEDLGFTGIWLMPIMKSTTYHKYDVVDYYSIDEEYGTMEDFEKLVEECHKRDIDVMLDLVVNHTSSKNQWFIDACDYLRTLDNNEKINEDDCKYVSYYNFTKEESDDSVYAKVSGTDYYYECPFWSEMPDLNLGNEQVRKEVEDIVDFWVDKDIDGFRLDAVKEYYSGQPTKNIQVLKWFTDYAKSVKPDLYLVAEVWEGVNTYSQYYESGIDSVFNFDFSGYEGKIAATIIRSGDRYSGSEFAIDMVENQDLIDSYNEDAIDANFFVNHDMARSAGYFVYDEEKIKLSMGMNLMMSGTTFTYYGEEIGLTGSGIDENKRAPMYWNDNGEGMTTGPIAMEAQENRFDSVDIQMKDDYSIYNYTKQCLAIRNKYPEIARGDISVVEGIEDIEICAISKTYNDEKLIILYNISDTAKDVKVDRTKYDYDDIKESLLVNEEEATLDDDTIHMPKYSIVILK